MRAIWLGLLLLTPGILFAIELPKALTFIPGPMNSVVIQGPSGKVVIYGGPAPFADAETVLLTHARRDAVQWARQTGLLAIAPEASAELLRDPQSHWDAWWEDRFNYYGQQSTKLPVRPLPLQQTVEPGDTLEVAGLKFEVVALPGYTLDMVGYVVELDGTRICFTGDLLQRGGKISDLYSFQDKIPEAKVGAYHGYGARLPVLKESLRKITEINADLLIPLRGPIMDRWKAHVSLLHDSLTALYSNYLSTNALHWYFGEERMRACLDTVVGPEAKLESMPLAEHVDLPDWCRHIGTTKLLLSSNQRGFALDVGQQRSLDTLKQLEEDGLLQGLDGIWVTHSHNDHSAFVRDAAEHFQCPVYAIAEVADVLTNPGAWFLPGVSLNAVADVTILKRGETMAWKEFTFTANFFPGQMYNHGALLVERADHKPVYFIGDSFSPSGMDDYCVLNRNLIREDTGYFDCLRKVADLPEGSWLVNQHIPHLFRFNKEEQSYLTRGYRKREEILKRLIAWDDLNYGLDEQWAWIYPYGSALQPGESKPMELRIWNHSQFERSYDFTIHTPEGLRAEPVSLTLPARGTGVAYFELQASSDLSDGVHVITVSILSEGPEEAHTLDLPHWCEALIRVGS